MSRPVSRYMSALCSLALASSALAVATAASAATLYASGASHSPDWLSSLYTVDPATGNAIEIGGMVTPAGDGSLRLYDGGLAYDPYTDRLYSLGNDAFNTSWLYLVDRATGVATPIGLASVDGKFASGGLTFDRTTHKLFAVGYYYEADQTSRLFEIDPATGAATVIGINGINGTYLYGLGCDPQTGVLYANGVINFDIGDSRLFEVDKTTGHATSIGPHGLTFGREMNYSGLAFDPASGTMYGFGSASPSTEGLYSVDRASGAVAMVGLLTPSPHADGGLVFAGPGVLDVEPAAARGESLRAWPTPTRGPVTLAYSLAAPAEVSLDVVDIAGRRVSSLVREAQPAGHAEARWDGRDEHGRHVAAGVYLVTLREQDTPLGRVRVVMLP